MAIEVCSYIAQLFSQTGRYAYVGNLCGAYTQNCYVYYIAEYFETYPYDFVAIYYIGGTQYIGNPIKIHITTTTTRFSMTTMAGLGTATEYMTRRLGLGR
ncbi:MAG: hypothetical protein QXK78_00935 [Candidatus Bathyarchaeia archaeon]